MHWFIKEHTSSSNDPLVKRRLELQNIYDLIDDDHKYYGRVWFFIKQMYGQLLIQTEL